MIMTAISKSSQTQTYKTGSIVEEDGYYVCVPCGYKKYLKRGVRFPNCIKCLGREKNKYRKGLELWEKL